MFVLMNTTSFVCIPKKSKFAKWKLDIKRPLIVAQTVFEHMHLLTDVLF